jgi:hypothetical protein
VRGRDLGGAKVDVVLDLNQLSHRPRMHTDGHRSLRNNP